MQQEGGRCDGKLHEREPDEIGAERGRFRAEDGLGESVTMQDAGEHRGADVLFFDDLPDNVAGARSFGWRAALVDPTSDPVAQMRAHLRETIGPERIASSLAA